MIKIFKVLLVSATVASVLASGGCSHESKCKELGGKVHSQNVYDDKGNFDHTHFQCVTHNGDITDEWDSKN